ncbi:MULTISPECIES: DUF4174 domain-containing protein [unclassified Polaribacter]|uniref:DUF4174 domain-containing protein n=1 Tax=unclassified Polaribacter TaxID=196858 RepID=UPI0011BD4BE8|nr:MULTISPECIES: DUF4174 domain-containing protein [unclassified Polaribacter]TXD53883.1 DUF4174 domain-containing protein [Polaribacter sp. IC063]TXD58547.1 DUF4174 domain-containing protein [Polaribacter sp. IC066]
MKVHLILGILLLIHSTIFGQDLEKHAWKNRVLLIFSKEENAEVLKKQLKILEKDKKGLCERKLEIYRFTPKSFSQNFDEVWSVSTYLFDRYGDTANEYQVILIGLDGGVKMKQAVVLDLEKLFAIIDGMPMRRVEVNTKN